MRRRFRIDKVVALAGQISYRSSVALKQFEDVSIEDPAITGHAGPCNDSCSRHDVKPKEDGE